MTKIPGPRRAEPASRGSKARVSAAVPGRESDERRGTMVRESEHLHSTTEAGELAPEDPVEGRRMPG